MCISQQVGRNLLMIALIANRLPKLPIVASKMLTCTFSCFGIWLTSSCSNHSSLLRNNTNTWRFLMHYLCDWFHPATPKSPATIRQPFGTYIFFPSESRSVHVASFEEPPQRYMGKWLPNLTSMNTFLLSLWYQPRIILLVKRELSTVWSLVTICDC